MGVVDCVSGVAYGPIEGVAINECASHVKPLLRQHFKPYLDFYALCVVSNIESGTESWSRCARGEGRRTSLIREAF